ncbi:hypothetical protein AOL_s00054g672 [Orbilia oligospora ATCC 24927]|uniref:Enoyl reductase (ER) domain-containing protein n=2 Tax=Orbilia oligospora TaxID=2813651 RepID=G1X728_ARTOA|nr:hypothetical protein AOL_s00054g672 [Orbilia oligospora ATCC 24927]EGX50936.1 hypothetical protein AOL_s00054g672 [Orbilia oligospora ATCC 24927]KAF3273338.1 hypothetical protein TWF970_009125 [Orbilia oligospora]
MTKYSAKQWFVKERSGDNINVEETFELVTKELSTDDLKEGDLFLKAHFFSNDPTQRIWVNKDSVKERLYRAPIEKGDLMEAYGIYEVIESRRTGYENGDFVLARAFWADYCTLTPIDLTIDPGATLTKIMGDPTDFLTLGITGITAYFGLLTVGAATSKDSTVVVSVAAGATGSVVCQIAKNVLGIKNVVGIAGSDAKCELLKKSCGCDYALNYRSPTFKQDFEEATKDDIDVYFDNVGGEILDMALLRMKEYGRIVSCGAISMYDDMKGGKASAGISREAWSQVYCHKVRIEGFIVIQFADQLPKALADLVPWLMEGKIHLIKEIWDARMEDVPQGMLKLFKGENTGKLITKIIHS